MKNFVVYTVLRIGLFVATFAVIFTVARLLFGRSDVVWFVSLLLSALISSLLSLRVLAGPRERLAEGVEARASRARAKLEEIRSSEDVD